MTNIPTERNIVQSAKANPFIRTSFKLEWIQEGSLNQNVSHTNGRNDTLTFKFSNWLNLNHSQEELIQ